MTDPEGSAALDVLIRRISRAKALSPATALFHDLSLAGDDALELLESMHARFGTRFDGFDFSRYFPDETEALSHHLLPHRRQRKKRLTVGHLHAVLAAGAWFDPEDQTP